MDGEHQYEHTDNTCLGHSVPYGASIQVEHKVKKDCVQTGIFAQLDLPRFKLEWESE